MRLSLTAMTYCFRSVVPTLRLAPEEGVVGAAVVVIAVVLVATLNVVVGDIHTLVEQLGRDATWVGVDR